MENKEVSIADLEGRAVTRLLPIIIFGLFQVVRHGIFGNDYLVLLVGSIFSVVAMFCYALLPEFKAQGRPKRLWMFFAAIGGFVPYIFALYLVVYRGFWHLKYLSDGFQVITLASSLFFVIFGFLFLKSYQELTDACGAVEVEVKK